MERDAARWTVDNYLMKVGGVFLMMHQLIGHDGRRTTAILVLEGGRCWWWRWYYYLRVVLLLLWRVLLLCVDGNF
jgi:hypothetical protein